MNWNVNALLKRLEGLFLPLIGSVTRFKHSTNASFASAFWKMTRLGGWPWVNLGSLPALPVFLWTWITWGNCILTLNESIVFSEEKLLQFKTSLPNKYQPQKERKREGGKEREKERKRGREGNMLVQEFICSDFNFKISKISQNFKMCFVTWV